MTTDVSSLKDISLIVVVNFVCVAAIAVGVFIWVRETFGESPQMFKCLNRAWM